MVVAALQRAIRRQLAEMPLADERRRVARFFQERWQRGFCRWQSDRGVSNRERLLEADGEAVLIAPGHERDSRRGADRGVRVGLEKAHAGRSQAIDVRGGKIGPAVAGDVRVAEIVGEDEDDVRLLRRRLREQPVRAGGEGRRAQRGAPYPSPSRHIVRSRHERSIAKRKKPRRSFDQRGFLYFRLQISDLSFTSTNRPLFAGRWSGGPLRRPWSASR